MYGSRSTRQVQRFKVLNPHRLHISFVNILQAGQRSCSNSPPHFLHDSSGIWKLYKLYLIIVCRLNDDQRRAMFAKNPNFKRPTRITSNEQFHEERQKEQERLKK